MYSYRDSTVKMIYNRHTITPYSDNFRV